MHAMVALLSTTYAYTFVNSIVETMGLYTIIFTLVSCSGCLVCITINLPPE